MAEFIIELGNALYNEETGEAVFKPKIVSKLVRCRDCKHYLNSNEKCELIDTRLHFYETDKVWAADCFCAWGER